MKKNKKRIRDLFLTEMEDLDASITEEEECDDEEKKDEKPDFLNKEADTSGIEGVDVPVEDEEEELLLGVEEEENPLEDIEPEPEEEIGGEDEITGDTLDIEAEPIDEPADEELLIDDEMPIEDEEEEEIIEIYDDEISDEEEKEDELADEPYMEAILRPIQKLVSEVKKIRAKNKINAKKLAKLEGRLNESELFNHKLAVTNQILAKYDLSEERKIDLITRIDEANSFGEVATLNKMLDESFALGTRGKSINELLPKGKKNSGSSPVDIPDVDVKRMQYLAGIDENSSD